MTPSIMAIIIINAYIVIKLLYDDDVYAENHATYNVRLLL